ncbi:immunoglobulin-like domain-containing protein [Acholeplasma hippikon]|uniref:Pesticidal crystal protein Cry22Aa Ig-like domain-containing protein n=1 Tax=Acholeplasma hippikon TaxID=264636 RepID=A0A449BJW0_9MOLU|nr:immunoglobulin-like domain-containing protein [Acholeplasma hippikon]VEU82756.1 Uncharacterised protein [Acholeplasma hippikon]
MKKTIHLILVLFSLLGVAMTTQKTFAAETYPLRVTINGQNYNASESMWIEMLDYSQQISFVANGIQYRTYAVGIYAQPYGGFMIELGDDLVMIDGVFNSITFVTYNPATASDGGFARFMSGMITEIPDAKSFTITATTSYIIPDNTRPAISGQETFVVSVDDPKPVSFFQGYLSAYDETDGNITNRITVKSENYTANSSTLGTYQITFSVKDTAQNESTLVVNVQVVDVTKPVITGNTSIADISYTQTWNINTFKSTLTVTDNVDNLNASNIVVESDGYTSNKTNLGTYTVVYSVTDSSGNKATFTKQVRVIDDVAPVFSGPTAITKPNNSILTVNDIKAQLSANDVKEGDKKAQITVKTDNYTGKGNITGSYTIVFEVKDSKGNTATHTVTVTVADNIPPVWYIQNGVSIKLISPATLTRQQILDLLVATGQLNINSTTQINFIIDEYTGHEDTAGFYSVTIGYSDSSGNEGIKNLDIEVVSNENTTPIVIEPEQNFFEKVGSFIKENPFETTLIGLGIVIIIGFGISALPKRRRY